MLLYKLGPDLPGLQNRIFNQPQFTQGSGVDRMELVRRNLVNVFVPTYAVNRAKGSLPLTGWYWVYMTPAMLIGSVAGIIFMALRRQYRLLAFLLVWIGVLLGPLILVGNVVYSRSRSRRCCRC